jgi:hypothetical protein
MLHPEHNDLGYSHDLLQIILISVLYINNNFFFTRLVFYFKSNMAAKVLILIELGYAYLDLLKSILLLPWDFYYRFCCIKYKKITLYLFFLFSNKELPVYNEKPCCKYVKRHIKFEGNLKGVSYLSIDKWLRSRKFIFAHIVKKCQSS